MFDLAQAMVPSEPREVQNIKRCGWNDLSDTGEVIVVVDEMLDAGLVC